MPYELSIYKSRLFGKFNNWIEKFEKDPLREDAYIRSKRIYEILSEIPTLEDDSFVPSDSVIREFIGGSTLKYH